MPYCKYLCFLCNKLTTILCTCCRLPTCLDCMVNCNEHMSWCNACIKNGVEHLKKYKPCCVCDTFSIVYRKIELLYPVYINDKYHVSRRAYVYANMCETCAKKYTWLIPYTNCDILFDISYSCNICININQLRDIMFTLIEEYIHLPKDLAKIVIEYYKPLRNYTSLYKFNLTAGRSYDILYKSPFKKII